FDIVAGKEYEISFAYKTSGNIEVSAGTADAGNVVKTAVATEGVTLMANEEWETSFLIVTPDRSSSDGYVLAFTVYAETAAEVYFDDITVTYESVGPVVLDEIDFGFTEDDFPTLNVFNKTETDDSEEDAEEIIIWDGTVAESFKEGRGTSADPYLISTPQELALAITQSGTTQKTVSAEDGTETTETVNEPYYGSYYKITADIYLNAKDAIDWKNASGAQSGLNKWYNYSENFAGTIDGDSHVIYGLYYYVGGTIQHSLASGRSGSGLIPQVAGANLVNISNLGIDCAYIRDRYTAAAFIANGAGNISSCYVGENVKIEGKDIGAFIGRAYTNNFTLYNCYSCGTVYGNSYSFYGLIGQVYQSKSTIKNCYNANGPLASYSNGNYSTWYKFYNSYETVASGNATYNDAHNIKTNVYTVTADQMQGSDVFLTESKMPYLALNTDGSANSAFTATEGYPVLSVFPLPVDEEETAEPEITYDIWDGTKTAPKDSDGDGVYEITKGSELAYIIVNHGTMITGTDPETGEDITADACSFILSNDIYLNDITKINWTTGEFATDYTPKSWFGNANYFAGTIDGNGYTVHGLFNVNSAINAKEWGVYGVGLVPRVLWDSAVTIKNLGIDHAYFNSDTGVSAFVGCGGTKNATPTTYAEITIDQCFAGKDVTLVGHSVGVFRGAGRGSNTYISNCYSLATLEATGEKGFVAMTWQAPVTIEKSFNANGTLVTSTSNKVTITDSYQTVAGEKTAVTDIANMKGSDVLTNADKMPLLNSELFSASENTFADYEFYVYLPAGTAFAEEVEATYYNELFIQLDKDLVVSDKTMLVGAYVKFAAEPVESKITLPFELKDYVRFGTKEELFLSEPYYGVKLDFITDNLEKDGDVVKYDFVTDIHYIGGEDVPRALATIRQLENLVSYVNENDDIDFVAIGGDTIQGTQPKATSIGYLKRAFNPFLKCNKPVVIVPGNHDDNSYAYDAKTFDGSKLITDKNWNDTVINTYVNRETPDGSLI
ncbi:MAG: metallophosphoesterase, partial [Clostridia bacterium]|nr:metallophosphoesterase [Clostridia bacterium]